MSTPNQPDESSVERGQVAPPWKRGEKSASVGMTAGELAKAAGVDSDRGTDRPAGPAPRGVVSGSAAAPTRAMPSQGGPGAGGAPKGASGPVQGPTPPPSKPVGPAPAPAPAPMPKPAAMPASGASSDLRQQTSPRGAADPIPAQTAEPKKFVESDTRNIPRDDLAKKDELPDLDAIHHVEASADSKAAARAQVKTIPSRSIGTPLRAAVQIRRVDPWSIFKVTGVLAVAGFFIWMIAVAILYGVLDGMGIWEQINSSFGTLVNADGSSSGGDLISTGMVFGFSALFGVVAVVLVTALATISAYIYNVCADMVGGVEVTLADLD